MVKSKGLLVNNIAASKSLLQNDETAWHSCHSDDLWIFDKLILSKKLGYICGPKGVDVPEPGRYIIRPCVNLMGMGRGAHIRFIERLTDDLLPDGSFWCEIFSGRHLSVDYRDGKQVLAVEGIRNKEDFKDEYLDKWAMWRIVEDKIPFPNVLKDLAGKYEYINVEMIGGKIIEVHLRRNPDFVGHNAPYVIPSYDKRKIDGHYFVDAPDFNRIGFFIPL